MQRGLPPLDAHRAACTSRPSAGTSMGQSCVACGDGLVGVHDVALRIDGLVDLNIPGPGGPAEHRQHSGGFYGRQGRHDWALHESSRIVQLSDTSVTSSCWSLTGVRDWVES